MLAVFDRAHFENMTGGDRALQREVIDLFKGQALAWEAVLAPAQDWRGPVHTMKGSARGIGLMALAQACEEAEGGAQAGPELARVRAALSEALEALRDFASD
jgi:HPt (histidine-containing phosphotransfer) domain-containing protein